MSATEGATPRCSVIIPAHNRGRYLAGTLGALAQQQVPEGTFEVVVVDDGSTDNTQALMTSRSWPFSVVYLRKENRNCRSETRNLGVLTARGEVIVFLDAEMLCPPRFIQAHLDLHRRYGPCAVCGWHGRLETSFGDPLPSDWLQQVQAQGPLDGCYPGLNNAPGLLPFITANSSCLRSDAMEAGLFDESFVGYGHEDLDLGMRLYLLGRRFVSDAATMAYHQFHPAARHLSADVQRNATRYYRKHHRRRRIAHLAVGLAAGGIERFVLALARRLHGRQHEFCLVIASAPSHYQGEVAELGVPVHQVQFGEIGRFLAQNPTDVVHIHTPPDWLGPLRRTGTRVPTIVTVHYPAPVAPPPSVSRVVCVTEDLARDQPGAPWQYDVIYPGTDLQAFAPRGQRMAARAHFGLPAEAFVVGTAVRIHSSKISDRMMDLYLELVRLHPRIHVLLLGAGENHSRFLEWVAQEGLEDRVHLPGAVDDVSFALEALDACVHAVEQEPFGLAILEAMMKGLPVVCPGFEGPRTTIGDNGAGFLCDDGEQMVRRVLELADGRHDLRAMGEQAMARARLFDDRRTAFRYKLLYDEVVDGARYWWPPHSA